VERSVGIAASRPAAACDGGSLHGGDRAGLAIAQLAPQNDAPMNASTGTRPDATGACAATNAATLAARSRSVPDSPGAIPNSESAQRVQRDSDAQRPAEHAPSVRCALVRARTCAAVARA
jgi:hypothetical protein